MSRGDQPRVLVVEDDAFQSLWLASVLEKAGYEVVGPAGSEVEALYLIGDDPPDAAILDIDLSGPGGPPGAPRGAQTSAQVMTALTDWGVPFIVATSHERVAFLPSVGNAACRLVKPLDAAQILDELEGLLDEEASTG